MMNFERIKAISGAGRHAFKVALLACVLPCGFAAEAQTPPAQSTIESKRTETAKELQDLTGQISLSSDRLASLDREIAGVKKDQTTITAALIQS
ncbi:MAG: hypothetical protein ACRECY_16450, partial [Phyllobacterium sp.]